MHKAQLSILRNLRYSEAARYSQLMHPTGLESDVFKFHVRTLVRLGYVQKFADGRYGLTAKGKEFANNLDEQKRIVQKQPKISVMVVVPKVDKNGKTVFLMQKRARNPFFGFWTEIHGRAVWGDPFEETAAYQLARQTGLKADFSVHSFRRIRDFTADGQELLEDKLFVIMLAENIQGELTNTYDGGENAWLSFEDLLAEDRHFASSIEIIKSLHGNDSYATQDMLHDPEEY